MCALLVQSDGLQNIDGLVQDSTAGSLVHAAALHAHQTVLDDVQQADAVLAADLVQVLDQLDSAHLLAVNGSGDALLEVEGDVGRGVGCLLGGNAQLEEAGLVVLRLVGGVLQIEALVAQVPQVLILGVVGLTVDLQGDVVCLGVVDLLVTALDVPLTPRSDDRHIGAEGLQGQLKTHLIVALAGAAVADGVCALLDGDVRQRLGDAGTCEAGAQQVVFVLCAKLQGGEDVVLDKVLLQVEDVQLGGAGLLGFLLQTVQLGALTDIAGDGDDLAVVVVLLQPGNDDGGIQTARVSQNNFLNIFLFHDIRSFVCYTFYTFVCRPGIPPGSLGVLSFGVRFYYTPSGFSVNAENRQTLCRFGGPFLLFCMFIHYFLNIYKFYAFLVCICMAVYSPVYTFCPPSARG